MKKYFVIAALLLTGINCTEATTAVEDEDRIVVMSLVSSHGQAADSEKEEEKEKEDLSPADFRFLKKRIFQLEDRANTQAEIITSQQAIITMQESQLKSNAEIIANLQRTVQSKESTAQSFKAQADHLASVLTMVQLQGEDAGDADRTSGEKRQRQSDD